MSGLAETVAELLYVTLPAWVRLPSLTFEMPHVLYWAGLIMFPLIAMYLVRREAARTAHERVTLPIAILLWITGGFVGLHRFYLRAAWGGMGYVALFLLVLYGNRKAATARNDFSEASNTFKGAEFEVEHFTSLVQRGRDGAAARLDQAKEALVGAQTKLGEAIRMLDQWEAFAGFFAAVIVIALVVDAFLLPRLKRRCNAREAHLSAEPEYQVMVRGATPDPRREIHTPVTRAIDAVSGAAGTFVAYWAVIAVFVYYYEVIARYVFNSPTNWAHESMFLMFGMQYLLSGAYALRDGAHVRVDVIYEMLSTRGKAVLDLITSVFFFVFTVTLLVTGLIFGIDAVRVLEVSFTEWAIQYWPVKLTIALGALLITLQGLAGVARDVTYLARRPA